MTIQSSPFIEVRETKKRGRGVFATRRIPKGTEFEVVPVLIVKDEEVLHEDGEVLEDYVFEWDDGCCAIALGFGSMYNHSYSPNARYDDFPNKTKAYTALRDIEVDEEITINYNGHEDDQTDVGFRVLGEGGKKKKKKDKRT